MHNLLLLISVFIAGSFAQEYSGGDDDALNPIKINEAFSMIPELTDGDVGRFQKAVQSNGEQLLFFYAEWCPACQDFKSSFNLLHENRFFQNNGISAYRVNVEDSMGLTARFFISKVPTLIHIRECEVRDVSKLRWKLVDYFEDKKWAELRPRGRLHGPFGVLASLVGMATLYGHFISRQAGSLGWPN
jgi:thiol-disulfide isomerase/thioredoxin